MQHHRHALRRLLSSPFFGVLLASVIASTSVLASEDCDTAPTGTGTIESQGDCYVKFKFVFCAPGENCVDDWAVANVCHQYLTPPQAPFCASLAGQSDGYSWDVSTELYCRTWRSAYYACIPGVHYVCHTITASNAAGTASATACAVVTCASPPVPCPPEE